MFWDSFCSILSRNFNRYAPNTGALFKTFLLGRTKCRLAPNHDQTKNENVLNGLLWPCFKLKLIEDQKRKRRNTFEPKFRTCNACFPKKKWQEAILSAETNRFVLFVTIRFATRFDKINNGRAGKASAIETVNSSSISGRVKPTTITNWYSHNSCLTFSIKKGECEASVVCRRQMGR